MDKILLNMKPFEMTEDKFLQFCEANRPFRFEMNAKKIIIAMPPTGFETSHRNLKLAVQLDAWNTKSRLGIVTESNGGFVLPNGSVRAPDVGFLSNERYATVPLEKRKGFIHVCPDFVLELMSPSDNLEEAQEKMQEWMANGCRLGWLIAPTHKAVWVYYEDGQIIKKSFSDTITGENVLPEFVLDLDFMKEDGL